MLDEIVGSILTESADMMSLSLSEFLICSLCSLLLGVLAAGIYMFRNSYSKSFVITIALLPAVVQLVIMLVNGNLGAGLAVMGAFSLVRFRSIPGSAKDIAAVFISMAIGLATGMGFLFIAFVFTVLIGAANVIFTLVPLEMRAHEEKHLKITIPESLDYNGMFDDIFRRYTENNRLVSVKTTNMGSLYQLQYSTKLKKGANEKEFIDALRTRNGNLEIALGQSLFRREEL